MNSEDEGDAALPVPHAGGALEEAGDPPVVARLIVEIRSDGSRTIARGAIEDLATGEKVALEARGTTPLQLASALTRTIAGSLLRLPLAARGVFQALLSGKKE